jgi:3'(2'), 5'-bisphosphate nucleotidase
LANSRTFGGEYRIVATHQMNMTHDELALRFAQIACDAGEVVMKAARTPSYKPDGSPVTAADTDAEQLIRARLLGIDPLLPIIAEESFDAAQRPARRFVLIDPLDGTRDFVAGGDEFTVNIALIEDGTPVAGSVYVPARKQLYLAGARAFTVAAAPGRKIAAADLHPLTTRAYPADGLDAVMSRSHLDADSQTLLDRLAVRARQPIGSSLKFCLLADGHADVYPRLAPTMEWDTAAGQAVLSAAGGRVLAVDGAALRYGKPGFRNTGFVAWGRDPVIV